MSTTRRLLALLFAFALVASACGSDDDSTEESSDTEAASPSESETEAGTEEPTSETEMTEEAGGSGDGESIRLWLNGGDTPDELVEMAVAEFNETHPDVEVVFERQQWTGLVEKLTTALASSDSPDVVEMGNTQAQAFEAAGALVNLTDARGDLGGDDLLESLVGASTYDGEFLAVPYYAGARVVVYRKDLFEAAGVDVPTTLDELVAAGEALEAASDDPDNFSGFYLPGRNWYAALSFVWETGGDIASQEDGEWVGQLASDESIEGLQLFQDIFTGINSAPADGDDSTDYIAFCNGEVGMMPAPGWKPGQIVNPDDGCPDMEENIGVFAMPGLEAGTTAPVFLGGSVLGIPAASEHPELAQDLLEVMIGLDYQTAVAETGLLPARTSLLGEVGGSEAAEAQATAAANSRFVPASENWASVEASFVLQDMLTDIAGGGDIAAAAESADAAIESALNG